jgi:Dolichyl-phosphate-mannose-protein mannosyltransferase
MVCVWTVVPSLLHSALSLDVIESGMWGREWVIGSYKHPALPSWCLELTRWVTGGTLGWTASLTSQLFNAATLWLTFLLLRDLLGMPAATAAVLPLIGIEHFSWRSFEFNHNIAQMPFWILAILCAWRAVQTSSIRWWIALGIVGAVGLYAKLSHVVIVLVIVGWMLWDEKARACFKTRGPWIAAALFVVTAAPLAYWFIVSGLKPLAFATERGGTPTVGSFVSVGANAVLVVLPAVAMLAMAGVLTRSTANSAATTEMDAQSRLRARRFLITMAIAPFVVAVLLALLAGSGLRQDWLAPMLCLVPALLVLWSAREISHVMLSRLWRLAIAVLIVVPVAYAGVVAWDMHWPSRKPMRVNWPQEAIAQQLGKVWSAETGRPLKIVAGPSWIAGLVGINNPDQPSILLNGDLKLASWLTETSVERAGALIVWVEGQDKPTPDMLALVGTRDVRRVAIPYPRARNGAAVVVTYVIVSPRS